MSERPGKVYLVGAGPGDPGLLTLRGAELLGRADVVLYDSLASARLLALATNASEKILVGKRHGRVTVSQENIERMLVERARAGKVVVRLKGGDPFVFGRGGEEAQACAAAGVAFEVVPGVTSAVAVPAYAGIPLTHRGLASAVTILTGNQGEHASGREHDWDALVRSGATLVFLMAMLKLETIVRSLEAAGLAAATPAAVIRWGSTAKQQTIVGTLGTIVARVRSESLRPPGVLVIGAVAALGAELAWYERLPLFGKKIVVTRASHQSRGFADLLADAGAEVIEYPVIEITDPLDTRSVDRALGTIADFDWLVLTSANGADRLFQRLRSGEHDIRTLAGVRIATIGPATTKAVEKYGVCVDVQASEFVAEGLVEAMGDPCDAKILIARAEEARDVLPRELATRGACVEVLPLYRTVIPSTTRDPSSVMSADLVTFTSASTVRNFLELTKEEGRELLRRVVVAAIGPITAHALVDEGFHVTIQPTDYTIPALADAIIGYFARQPGLE